MLFSAVLLLAVLAIPAAVVTSHVTSSHCPQVLSYDNIEAHGTRYNATILLQTKKRLRGFHMDIELERPIQLLANTIGEVTSTDNKHFSIVTGKLIDSRSPFALRISVKYSAGNISFINSIKLNNDVICAPVTNKLASGHTDSTTSSRTEPTSTSQPRSRTLVNIETTTEFRNQRPTDPIPTGDSHIECGVVAVPESLSLIVHGQATSPGQWPWHIAISSSVKSTVRYICGGTLISRRRMITAAHCVTNRQFGTPVDASTLRVGLGKHYLKSRSEAGVQEKGISKVIVYPTYNQSSGFVDDIAILEFDSPVEYTAYVRPVCLWDKTRAHIEEHRNGTVVGWGFDATSRITEELTVTSLPVVSYETCIKSKPKHFVNFLRNTTYCAGYHNQKGPNVCNGDSGGGMIFPTRSGDKKIWYLRGIVSNAVPKSTEPSVCDPDNYAVFTDVTQYLGWIKPYLTD